MLKRISTFAIIASLLFGLSSFKRDKTPAPPPPSSNHIYIPVSLSSGTYRITIDFASTTSASVANVNVTTSDCTGLIITSKTGSWGISGNKYITNSYTINFTDVNGSARTANIHGEYGPNLSPCELP